MDCGWMMLDGFVCGCVCVCERGRGGGGEGCARCLA